MNEKKPKFIGYYNKSVILTFVGIMISVMGMTEIVVNNNLKLALICLILAGICDMFDGAVARKCQRTDNEKLYGVQLDSLADMICSVAFPLVIFINSVEMNGNIRQTVNSVIVTVIVGTIYTLASVIRLSWFNTHTANIEEKAEYYTGLPVTFIAMILPIAHLIGFAFDLCNLTYYITMTITALLFIGNFKVKKLNKLGYAVLILAAIIATVLIFIVIK